MGALTETALDLDPVAETEHITARLRDGLRYLGRRGAVIGVSGGVDSAVCATLAVRAIGAERVFCLMMPERDSSDASLMRGLQLVTALGAPHAVKEITSTLEAIGAYDERDEAVRSVFPDSTRDWKWKIAIGGGLEGRYNSFDLIALRPGSSTPERRRLDATSFFRIVAATNYKQRVRKSIEYFHADRLHYAVIGTPNRLEYDQGFFVKLGDGAADIKPIAHLYKSQVYALARHLGVPPAILNAAPTTDTYSLPQGQDEFYFALPFAEMDRALWARNHDVSAEELARELGIDTGRAERIYADIEAKRRATRYLHLPPLLAGPIDEVGA